MSPSNYLKNIQLLLLLFVSLAPTVSRSQAYCTAFDIGGNTSCTYNGGITNVTFAGINNTTACILDNYSYADYSTTLAGANVMAGSSYTVSVTINDPSANSTAAVWIDFNQNKIFESSEFFSLGTNTSSASGYTFTASIPIPSTAVDGPTRMRVRTRRGNGTFAYTNACGAGTTNTNTSTNRGEIEDYTVNISVPGGCNRPSSVNVSAITVNSANLNWTASSGTSVGYEYYVSQSSTAPVSGTVPSGSVFTLTTPITGLLPNTQYYAWVRNDCGSGSKSQWSNPVSFSTLCSSYPLPLIESFASNIIPSCWKQAPVNGTNSLTFESTSSSPVASPFGGMGYMVKWNSTSIAAVNASRLISPPLTSVGKMSVIVEFQWHHHNSLSSYNDKVQVQYSTDGITWANAGSEIVRYFTATGWYKKTIALPVAADNQPVLYVGFLFTSANGYSCYLDEINIQASQACAAPVSAAIVNNISSSGASVSWMAPASIPSNGYEYYSSTSSTVPVLATTASGSISAGITTKALSGLAANTTYYVWIRSNCGSGAVSAWNPYVSFTTLPALVATAGPQTNVNCNGGNTGSATVNVTGGSGGYTYLWSPYGGAAATASSLAAGNYSVLITDSSGVTTAQSFTITEPDALIATAGVQTNVNCHGGNTGSATVNVTGGTGTYTYIWSPSGQTSATATNLTAGTYVVTVKDAKNCETTQSFTITEPDALIATAGPQMNVNCNGDNTGSATVNVTGGMGRYTYIWSPSGQTSATATNLTAGTYVVTVKDAKNCETTQNFTITEPDALIATAGPQTNVNCHGDATGSATVNVTGGTGTYTYIWSPSGQTSATATNLTAGTYVVTVKDAKNCETTQSFTITEPDALIATAGPQTNVNCNGDNTGSATVNVLGGAGAYTYIWSPSGQTSATATNLTAGTYVVRVKDAKNCEATQSFTITEPNALIATAGVQTNVNCNGGNTGSATVNVTGGTGGYTYIWSPSGQTSATATNLTAGTYVVTVKDAKNCEATQSFTITEPDVLVATAGVQTNVNCNGGNTGLATVNVTGGTGTYTYIWSPSGQTSATATNLTAGTYVVTVKDAKNCETTQSFTITEPDALVATAGPQTNVFCNGGNTGSATVNVTGGTGTYTYIWSPSGQTSTTATNLSVGTHTVTVKDAKNCETTQSFTITEPDALIAAAGVQTNVNCNGDATGSATVNVTGGTGTYTYIWSPSGQTSATATNLSVGTHTVIVKDATNCETTQNFTITEPDALVATAGVQTNVNCHGGNTGSATVNVTGGTGTYTYIWSPSGQTSATATNLIAGTYVVTVKDAKNCETTQNFTITEPDALIATAGVQTNVFCNGGNTGSATVNVTGGTGMYTYIWSPSGQTSATAIGLLPGNHIVLVTDSNGCAASQSFTIIESAPFHVAFVQNNISCSGDNNGSISLNVTGGAPPYTYAWTPAVSTEASASGLGVGNYSTLITDSNGCTYSIYFSVSQPPDIVITNHPENRSIYSGETAVFSVLATNANVYQWQYSDNGNTWYDITDGGTIPVYAGAATPTLTVSTLPLSFHNYKFRVIVSKNGNCQVVSNVGSLNIMNSIRAVDDDFSTTVIVEGTGGIAGNITINDIYNNSPVNSEDVEIAIINNGGIAGLTIDSNGNVIVPPTAVAGTYAITYSLCDKEVLNNCSSAQVIIVVSPILNNKHFLLNNLDIYPNPATETVFIRLQDVYRADKITLCVYDLNGRIVKRHRLDDLLSEIDISSFEAGVYIFNLSSIKGSVTQKIVKIK
jgi:hypothetical protein